MKVMIERPTPASDDGSAPLLATRRDQAQLHFDHAARQLARAMGRQAARRFLVDALPGAVEAVLTVFVVATMVAYFVRSYMWPR
jgi:hypothetical protein